MRKTLIIVLLVAACGKKGEQSKPVETKPVVAVPLDAASAEPAPMVDAAAAPSHSAEAPRAPTPEEIDRCARLLVVTAPCGVKDDFEFGWIKAKPTKPSAVQAKKTCSVEKNITDDGQSTFPAKLLAADALATVEAAAKTGCKDVLSALDQVDPRIGPAGSDPSR